MKQSMLSQLEQIQLPLRAVQRRVAWIVFSWKGKKKEPNERQGFNC
jgi:hypothetical protein